MAPKSNAKPAKKGKKGKGQDSTQKEQDESPTTFQAITFNAEEMKTTVLLLTSTEYNVVVKALSTLSAYGDQRPANKRVLYEAEPLMKLADLLHQTDLVILRFASKLIAQLIDLEEVLVELTDAKYFESVKFLLTFYLEHKDLIIKENSLYILAKLAQSRLIATFLFKSPAVTSTFEYLATIKDPDMQLNLLELLHHIVNVCEAEYSFHEIPKYNPKILLCFLKSHYMDLQNVAMNIFHKTANWKTGLVQPSFCESGVLEAMVNILQNELLFLHSRAINVIQASLVFPKTTYHFVGTVEFLQFTRWALDCTNEHLPAVSTILAAATKYPDLRQLLFNFSVEDIIVYFLKSTNEYVLLNLCDAMSDLTSHRYCCDKMLTPTNISNIANIIRNDKFQSVPLHEKAIATLYHFLTRNPLGPDVLYNSNALEPVLSYYLSGQDKLTPDGFTNVVDIIGVYCFYKNYRKEVVKREIYCYTWNLLMENDSVLAMKAIGIVSNFIDEPMYRDYFLEHDGPSKCLKKLETTCQEQIFLDVILFIHRIIIYRDIAMEFLKLDCLRIFKIVPPELKEKIPLIDELIRALMALHLPLKFFETGRLEIDEKLRNHFYLITGKWTASFPFLEVVEAQQLSTYNTIYIAQLPDPVCEIDLGEPSTSSLTTDEPSSSPVLTQLENSPMLSSCENKMPARLTADDAINYGGLSADPYLAELIEIARKKVFYDKQFVLCLEHRVKVIAMLVVNQFVSSKGSSNRTKLVHSVQLHRAALKDKLGTNMIPIGFVRIGSYCERALLFKILADCAGVPATLVKGCKDIYYNEVPIVSEQLSEEVEVYSDLQQQQVSSVVDLMYNVGNLLTLGTSEADSYCSVGEEEQDLRKILTKLLLESYER